MATIWILEVDNSPDLKAFSSEGLGLTEFYYHIGTRIYGSYQTDIEDNSGYGVYSCYHDGEFIAKLREVEVQNGQM